MSSIFCIWNLQIEGIKTWNIFKCKLIQICIFKEEDIVLIFSNLKLSSNWRFLKLKLISSCYIHLRLCVSEMKNQRTQSCNVQQWGWRNTIKRNKALQSKIKNLVFLSQIYYLNIYSWIKKLINAPNNNHFPSVWHGLC